jgi:hypothetical protein
MDDAGKSREAFPLIFRSRRLIDGESSSADYFTCEENIVNIKTDGVGNFGH